jgi:endonuclease III related protein
MDTADTRCTLQAIFGRLESHYGPQGWWPTRNDSPWEVMLGAVLVQRTTWRNVETSLEALVEALGESVLEDPQVVLGIPDAALTDLLRPAGYPSSKPRKMRSLARFVVDEGGIEALRRSPESTEALRHRLLGVWGIGPETADDILLYALGRPVFVADAYTLRLAWRWGLASPASSYAELQRLFTENLPADVSFLGEYHALIVAHGKQICRPRPLCSICPLGREINVQRPGCEPATWTCPRLGVRGSG